MLESHKRQEKTKFRLLHISSFKKSDWIILGLVISALGCWVLAPADLSQKIAQGEETQGRSISQW